MEHCCLCGLLCRTTWLHPLVGPRPLCAWCLRLLTQKDEAPTEPVEAAPEAPAADKDHAGA